MVNKIPDNLKPEGQFEQRQPVKWYPGDRAERVIRKDNLRMEGDRQLIAFSRNEYNATCNDGMHMYIPDLDDSVSKDTSRRSIPYVMIGAAH